MDVVWDTYIPDSLKESIREKRGECVRRKVSGETKLPGNWMDFLRNSMNKQELFALFIFKFEEFNWPSTNAVYVTSGKVVLWKGSSIAMQIFNHEEADIRIVVHVIHALQHGAKTIQVRTVEHRCRSHPCSHDLTASQPFADIWVAFGMGNNFRFYHINAICASLGSHDHDHYLCFTHSLVAIKFPPSTARAKCGFGMRGRYMKTSRSHLCI